MKSTAQRKQGGRLALELAELPLTVEQLSGESDHSVVGDGEVLKGLLQSDPIECR